MRSLLLLAGILFALWLPAPQQESVAWLLAAVLLLLLWCHRSVLAQRLVCGVGGALYALLILRSIAMPLPLEPGERLLVQARVLTVPALDDSGWQFDARVSFARHADWPTVRWRLRLPASMQAPAVGERWQYALRFDPPRDARERRQLLRDRVAARARLVEGSFNHPLQPARASLDGLRARLARRIADRVADPSAASLLAALAVGVTGEVSARQWQVFNATGVTHLVAISGMHVTFFAMLSMALARRIWPRLANWPGMPRRESFSAGIGILLALLYALLAGFSVPTQRTVVMLAAFLVARQCARYAAPSWSIAVALALVLLYDPLAALSAGFWLSYFAVAAIVLLAGARLAPGAPLATAVRVQWLVSLALLPVTVAIFGTFSAAGLLANALAIPVFTFLLVPPVLLATACYLLPLGPAGWCGDRLVDLAAWVAGALWPFLSWCAALPGALWRAGAPWSWYLLAFPAVLLALLPVARGLRAMALALLASVFLLREPRPRTGELWIDVPDAGDSSAIWLRTRERSLLWGTGESFGARGRAFARQLLPLLRAGRHEELDLWLPGSLTRDAQVALQLGAAALTVARTVLPPARGWPPEAGACGDEHWSWDGIDFVLAASADGRACLLTVRAGESILRLGADDSGDWPAARGATQRLLFDARGIRQRPWRLGL